MRILSYPFHMISKCMVVVIIFLIFATTWSFAGIAGSAHDFSAAGWNSSGEICMACHTPHNANLAVSEAPLWNHEVSAATYTVYSSTTLDAVGQPIGITKLCLSCHDGTIALDSFGGNTGSTNINGLSNVGTDLSDDHPVGISWNHSVTNSCSNCHFVNPGPSENYPLPFFNYGTSGNELARLECATCHDPHNDDGFPKLLRMSMNGSELCQYCHDK